MKVDVLTWDGKKSDQIDLPKIFDTKLNVNLIHKAYINLESHGFQKHSTKPTAGMEVVADSNDPPTGRGVARIAKIKGGGGGRAGQAGEVASRETKKAAVETATAVGKGASQGIKKRKERALDNIQKNTEKLFSGEVKEAVAKPKKKYGKFEKAGRVIGGIGGSIGGGIGGAAAAGAAGSVVPVAGTAAGGLAGGVAGSLAGDAAGTKTGGSIGKKIDKILTKKKKPMVAKEEKLDEFDSDVEYESSA